MQILHLNVCIFFRSSFLEFCHVTPFLNQFQVGGNWRNLTIVGIHSQFYDPRPLKARTIDSHTLVKLKNDLQAVNPKIPFALMLPADDTDISTVNTLFGPVAKGSVLHTQLRGFDISTENNYLQPTLTSSSLHSSQSNDTTDQLPMSSNITEKFNQASSSAKASQSNEKCMVNSPNLPLRNLEENVDLNPFQYCP